MRKTTVMFGLVCVTLAMVLGLMSCGPDSSLVQSARDYVYLSGTEKEGLAFTMGELIDAHMTGVSWSAKPDENNQGYTITAATGNTRFKGAQATVQILFWVRDSDKKTSGIRVANSDGDYFDDAWVYGLVRGWAQNLKNKIDRS